jgi:hypothetical protein
MFSPNTLNSFSMLLYVYVCLSVCRLVVERMVFDRIFLYFSLWKCHCRCFCCCCSGGIPAILCCQWLNGLGFYKSFMPWWLSIYYGWVFRWFFCFVFCSASLLFCENLFDADKCKWIFEFSYNFVVNWRCHVDLIIIPAEACNFWERAFKKNWYVWGSQKF